MNFLTYKEGVSCKIEFTFSNVEFLKNRSDFLCEIVKFANFNISWTAMDKYVSRMLNLIDNIVKHFGC